MDKMKILSASKEARKSPRRRAIAVITGVVVVVAVLGGLTLRVRIRVRQLQELKKHAELIAVHISYSDEAGLKAYAGGQGTHAPDTSVVNALLKLKSFEPEQYRLSRMGGSVLGAATKRVMLVKTETFPLAIHLRRGDARWTIAAVQENPPEDVKEAFTKPVEDRVTGIVGHGQKWVSSLSSPWRWGLVGMGVLLLFAGNKIFRDLVALPGFLIGAVGGGMLGMAFWDVIGAVLGVIILGLIGAALAKALFDLSVFIMGFLGGMLGTGALWMSFGGGGAPPDLVLVIVGAICGCLTIPFVNVATAIASALLGSTLVCAGLGWASSFIAILILWILGAAVQIGFVSRLIEDNE